MVCVLGGTKNPRCGEVAEDISNALIRVRAHDGILAHYWSQEEQARRLVDAFDKWAAIGGIWSAAAEKVCGHIMMRCGAHNDLFRYRHMANNLNMSGEGASHVPVRTLQLMEVVSRVHTRDGTLFNAHTQVVSRSSLPLPLTTSSTTTSMLTT